MPLSKATDAELRVLVAEVRKGHEALSAEFKTKHEENAREFDGIKAEQKAMRKDITSLQAITGSVNELRTLMTDHAATDLRELGVLKSGQATLMAKMDDNTAITEKVDNFLRFGRGSLSVAAWLWHFAKGLGADAAKLLLLYLLVMWAIGRGPMPPLH